MRVCLDCPELTDQRRCPKHRLQQSQTRGSSSARGYGTDHRRLRSQHQQQMDAGQRFTCWRCGETIDPNAWTLGHCDEDRNFYHGPECPPCDYATAGRDRCPHPSHISPAA